MEFGRFEILKTEQMKEVGLLDLKATGDGKVQLSVEGKSYLAIFSISGDTLRICRSNDDHRPSKLQDGRGEHSWVLKKIEN